MSDNKRSLRSKVMNLAANPTFYLALRALQFILAIGVVGAIGSAIHDFRGYIVVNNASSDTITEHVGFPDAWGFLMFTALWTFLGVIFGVVAGHRYPVHRSIGYARVFVELVALLSWLVGFIASAVHVGTQSCPLKDGMCGSVNVAVVLGSLETLLFLVTVPLTSTLVFFLHGSSSSNITNNNNANTRQVKEVEPEKSLQKDLPDEWQPEEKPYEKEDV